MGECGAGRLGDDVIGVVPAAGLARRLGRLPCSKEIFPVGFTEAGRPRPVGQYLLERMRRAGVRRVYIVLREGKWDIPATFGDGHALGMQLAYLMMRRSDGPAFTIGQVCPFAGGARVVMGFPDILFEPADAYLRLLERLAGSGAAAVLGLFPAAQPQRMDMVETDAAGRVRAIEIKPAATRLRETWILAAWAPSFSAFLHQHLQRLEQLYPVDPVPGEVHVGHVLQAAIEAGLPVEAVRFPEGRCLDIGTPHDLMQAVRQGGDLNRLPASGS